MLKRVFSLATCAAAFVAVGCSRAPEPSPSPAPNTNQTAGARGPAAAGGGAQGGDSARGGGAGEPRPRPYNRVITSEAKTRRGLFSVHRVGSKLFFEIPASELGKDQLMIGRFARASSFDPNSPTGGFGSYGGDQFGERTLRWERNGNRVVLR
ncbi:MAG TPA: DUF5118 domain-containing protein, partial [Gemmatimonadaceae bacterium]|nr:DUF5118 domain-containing protein [Gemmatimonadaceae bacterium]